MAHILIVDDNADFAVAIGDGLQLRGYTVSSASNGVEALQQADQNAPDLILLDIEMPQMDGLQFCQELRSSPRFHSVPVIFMSVRCALADKLAAYKVGADDYLAKPFDMLELSARLQAVLRRSAPQSTAEYERNDRMLEVCGLRLYLDNARVEWDAGEACLTPAEFELLKFLMLHPDQTLSGERLLQDVWLYPVGVGDPAVVRWHVKNLRRKIEAEPDKPVRLRTISHHGYILVSYSGAK
jgi:DNA-binding response OmpR family regulator